MATMVNLPMVQLGEPRTEPLLPTTIMFGVGLGHQLLMRSNNSRDQNLGHMGLNMHTCFVVKIGPHGDCRFSLKMHLNLI